MRAIFVGGPCHGQVVEISEHQDVYRPGAGYSPRYVKLRQSADRAYAYFASSNLSDCEANRLMMEHVGSSERSQVPASAMRPDHRHYGQSSAAQRYGSGDIVVTV